MLAKLGRPVDDDFPASSNTHPSGRESSRSASSHVISSSVDVAGNVSDYATSSGFEGSYCIMKSGKNGKEEVIRY
jgi:hypothetical protein